MRKLFCFMAILLIFIPVSVFSETTYDAKNKLLSVKAEGSPLKKLLSEVSAKTGIDVYVSPAIDKNVFAEIKSESVEVAIKRMIKPLNNAFIYEGESIKVVKIFEKSEAEATLQIEPRVTRSVRTSPSYGQGLDKRILSREELKAKAGEIAESRRLKKKADKKKSKEERGSGKGRHRKQGKKNKAEERERMLQEQQQEQNQDESGENMQNNSETEDKESRN